jgi:hypothetical protein
MNPFLLSPRERLTMWKTLRNSLKEVSDDEQLAKVALFWGQCPIQKYALDADDPSSWVTCWEMIHRNDFDRNSIAVGMEMTLRLAGWAAGRLMLMMVDDEARNDVFMVLKIDGTKLLNYNHNSVCDMPKVGFQIIVAYQFTGDLYHQIAT